MSDNDSDERAAVLGASPGRPAAEGVPHPPKKHDASSIFIPALSNFAIQYNLSAASIALPFLQSHPAFAPPGWVRFLALGVVFAGCMIGMLLLGYLGDLIGRARAMVVTNGIQVVGALGCALLTWGSRCARDAPVPASSIGVRGCHRAS